MNSVAHENRKFTHVQWERIQWTVKKLDRVYLMIFAIFVALGAFDFKQIVPLGKSTLSNLASTAPYMIFAVLLIAGLKASGAEALIAQAFKGREKRMIVFAALLGGLAPFCSCEVIPFIAGLLALGTPLSAIMAFWLSSPLIDPPTLLITASALGWNFAIAKAVFAVSLGLMGGFAIKLCTSAGWFHNPLKPRKEATPSDCCSGNSENAADGGSCGPSALIEKKPVWRFWMEKTRVETFRSEMSSNALFLLKWMLFAYTLESLMIFYVPAEAIASVVGGNGLLPIVLSALVGIPAYLNSYIAPPLVAGMIQQGMSSGSGMAFIVAGAVSSIPAMTAVFALVRRSVFVAYLALGFFGAVLSGVIFGLI